MWCVQAPGLHACCNVFKQLAVIAGLREVIAGKMIADCLGVDVWPDSSIVDSIIEIIDLTDCLIQQSLSF